MAHRSRLDRRQFVRLSALAAGGAALAPRASSARAAGLASAQGTVTLTFMHWGDLNEKQAIADVIERFEEANPNIRIEAQHVPDDYGTKLNTLAAANELPDLFHMSEGPAHTWAEEGRIMDMTPFLDQYPEFKNRLPQTFYYFAPGKTFGTMNAAEIALLFYNRELFEAAGVEPPPAAAESAYTWDQFVDTAKRVTLDNEGRNATDPDFDPENIKQFGVSFPTWWLGWYPLVKSNGGDLSNEDGTQYTLNSPEAVQVFQNLQDLIHTHRVAPTPSQAENLPATTALLQTKRVAMVIDGQWNLMSLGEAKVPVGVGVLPKFKEPVTVIVGSITAINAETEHPEEALAFWLYHNDPRYNLDLYARGLMMPLEEKYYTDPASIALWASNDAHPDGYKEAAIDYLRENAVASPIIHKDFEAINARLESGLDPLWAGDKTAQEALDELAGTLQPLLKGKYPAGGTQ